MRVDITGASVGPTGNPGLSAVSSRRTGIVAVTLINPDHGEPAVATIEGAGPFVSGWVLYGDSPNATNTAANPHESLPDPFRPTTRAQGDGW